MAERILFVCHANLCRSPMAEYLATGLLAHLPVTVVSAGTDAVEGRPMHPYAAEVAAGTGRDPEGFRSRRVDTRHLLDAALVLTASRHQRGRCVSLAPAALHRVFTLRQFGRLADLASPPETGTGEPVRAVVRAAAQARGRLQPAAPADDDLADPLGGELADFQRCAREIERCVLPVAALIDAAG
ncbi:protein tyrosine phosphatase [Micromonospora rosaria]|uniref:Protein tyrosine phosphatase n=1 Tax=Micromonospora rosaria TaxID=47874 RepID=A0A136PJH6_9ACTN|nr:protein tyrosine phosphatase [Micromonospora rosaria]KXK58501.1 protein tyrosine phosphatase [Micromonospora rosaria]